MSCFPTQSSLKNQERVPEMAKAICKNINEVNHFLNSGILTDYLFKLYTKKKRLSYDNVWVQNEETFLSYPLLCAGLEFEAPQLRFERTRVVLSYKMNKNPTNIDAYCYDSGGSMKGLHPAMIDEPPKRLLDVKQSLWTHFEVLPESWWQFLYQKRLSVVLNALIYHVPFEQLCRVEHPDLNTLKCALMYSTNSIHYEVDSFTSMKPGLFDKLGLNFNPGKVYWNFSYGVDYAIIIEQARNAIGWLILIIGAVLHVFDIKLRSGTFLAVCIVLNTVMQVPDLFLIEKRFGVDTTAYIN